MASTTTLCKKLLNVKTAVITGHDFYSDRDGINHLRIYARPNRWHEDDCPICHKRCPKYDVQTEHVRTWRGLDWGGTLVEVACRTHRIRCPEHGVLVAAVPWAYPGSGFTKDFDLTVGWLAVYLSRSAISAYMRIDWDTVGRCISRTLAEIEPERSRRLDGLVNIGIDETSYKKGHKYITVVVNHDTNTVVWAAEGHGKSVLRQFYRQLTKEQLSTIRVVTGDGAKWITECVNEYTPDCERCVDPFHVVQWAMEALDEVRRQVWHEAYDEAKALSKEHPQGRGRPKSNAAEAVAVKQAKQKASEIKNAGYALGKAPEHLTDRQRLHVEMIANTNKRLYRAYMLKEDLRLLLKLQDIQEAEAALNRWLWWASHSRIPAFKELYKKIKRHKTHILNAIRLGMSNARIEAINNKIKLIIRKAYGFRNIENMLDMIYLVCSDLDIPLPNRKPNLGEAA
ncbi:MAG: ISL3 family transposase [Acidaminococcaceae bacterium]|nr:ISL3 family transposase [Acidaminococcaceae bacterium]